MLFRLLWNSDIPKKAIAAYLMINFAITEDEAVIETEKYRKAQGFQIILFSGMMRADWRRKRQ